MSRDAGEEPTPASYADFEETPKAGVLQTLVQFFAIPLLIVCVAVGLFVGFRLLFGGGPQTLQDFAELMRSDSINRRWQAAMEVSVRVKRAILAKEDAPLRLEAQDEGFVRTLIKVLDDARTEAPSREARAAGTQILVLLGWIRSPIALDAVRSAARDPDPWIRTYAVSALGNMHDVASKDLFLEYAPHEDPGTRQAALQALANLDFRPGRPLVLTGKTREIALTHLGDAHENVRFQAAVILAWAGDRAALPVLKRFLNRRHLETFEFDDSLSGLDPYRVRGNALEQAIDAVVLLEAGDDPEVIDALQKLADDEYEGLISVRQRARTALRKLQEGS